MVKNEPRMKRENNIGYILCKVGLRVWKWPVVKDKHIRMKPRIYVLFLFDLGGECKCIKSKAIQLLKKYVQLAATFFCKQNLLIFVQPRWQPKIGPNYYTEDSYW